MPTANSWIPAAISKKWDRRRRFLSVVILASAAAFFVASLGPSSFSERLVGPAAINDDVFILSKVSPFSNNPASSEVNTPVTQPFLLSEPPLVSREDFREPKNVVFPATRVSLPPSPANSQQILLADPPFIVFEDFREPKNVVFPATSAAPPPSPAAIPPPPFPAPMAEYSSTQPSIAKVPVTLFTKVDEELIYAKREIDRASVDFQDPDLYAPLFHNVSVFKRSYELMEKTLKVYVYEDGPRPIFHTPQLKGIYASEGWFLKLMEESKKFVVKDPKKAHLFYLPYSSRRLEEALYKPNSHDMKPLLIFLKDYVNMLSSKYPFWNRTKGSDHFIVACHDWGPYTTRLHEEFRKNTIKALCNADVSEGVFVRGKDVSLPETNIRMPKKPLKDIGGNRVSRRPILAFFAGNMHGRVRPVLLDHWSGKDDDFKIYGALPTQISRTMSYVQHMKSSKYCICPMGYEVNSPRIVEAIYYECVPVIIADNFVLPFEELLNWREFSVIVAEKDIPKLKEILNGIPLRNYVKMQGNVKRLQRHFLWHSKPVKYDLFHMILHSIWFNRLNQIKVYE